MSFSGSVLKRFDVVEADPLLIVSHSGSMLNGLDVVLGRVVRKICSSTSLIAVLEIQNILRKAIRIYFFLSYRF